MSEKLAYSTSGSKESQKDEEPLKVEGPLKMRLETKGRGGKSVTVVFNFSYSKSEAKSFLKDLQSKLGCGGTFKDGRIEFRGDMRDRIEAYLKEKGVKIIRAGG